MAGTYALRAPGLPPFGLRFALPFGLSDARWAQGRRRRQTAARVFGDILRRPRSVGLIASSFIGIPMNMGNSATLKDYFATDYPGYISFTQTATLTHLPPISGVKTPIATRALFERNSGARFTAIWIGATPFPFDAVKQVIGKWHADGRRDGIKLELSARHPADLVFGPISQTLINKIYIYSESALSQAEQGELQQIAQHNNIQVVLRGPEYLAQRMMTDKPLAFISHDSRDKTAIAEQVAIGLTRLACPVWYDAFSLRVGDSLRESIEKGIKEASKCILILTPNFLDNTSWAKNEYDVIFTKERITKQRVILPIWCGVTKEAIYEYSPSLANCFALTWPEDDVTSLEESISKRGIIQALRAEVLRTQS